LSLCWPKAPGPGPSFSSLVAKRGEEWQFVHDLADRARATVKRAFLAAVASLPDIAVTPLRQALRARDLSRLLELIAPVERGLQHALKAGDFVDALEDTYLKVARESGVRLAAALRRAPVALGFRFDMTNPRAVEFLAGYQGDLIRELTKETVGGIMDVIRDGYDTGFGALEMERQILSKPGFGLTARQRKSVERYHQTLLEGGVPPDRALAQRGVYERKVLSFRAETIARTETIRAAEYGRYESWRQAADQGLFDVGTTRVGWIVTPDDRLCPICRSIKSMNPDGVPFGQEFLAPGNRRLRNPPAHPRCRCGTRLIFNKPYLR
jgi:hypothetical protein